MLPKNTARKLALFGVTDLLLVRTAEEEAILVDENTYNDLGYLWT